MARRNDFYEGVRTAMVEGIVALRQGRPLTRRDVTLAACPAPMTGSEVLALRRRKLGVSQYVFARLLNVSPATVQAWEQGRNAVAGATLRLLRLAEKDPSIFSRLVDACRASPARRAARPRALRRRRLAVRKA